MTDDLTKRVQASFTDRTDERLMELLVPLVQHLHDYAREVDLKFDEWEYAIDFLTRTGQQCDDVRQEFVLLSDVLGLSTLIEQLDSASHPEATASTVLGPFHLVASPARRMREDISAAVPGSRALVRGRVIDTQGRPVAGAQVDVWQSDADGNYDVQREPDQIGVGRGLFTAGEDGSFEFVTVRPSKYPVPTDGPVGQLLGATGRHPYRPAHIHFQVTAPGHLSLTTHVFDADSEYLDTDTVFAATPELEESFVPVDDPQLAGQLGIANPFQSVEVELVLAVEGDA
ncbi:dioxygenase [Flexivirga meconopsidis]|uniref:dioxygenase family protein n=1 Tax=Flexivirga meconopsidis TaxID=2977121 RepID=UPI0022404849|nr:dioxygenase [Flexivirga meconopsidis]